MVQDIKEERYSPRFSVSDENYYRYPAPAHSYGMNTVSSYTSYDNMNYQVNNIRRVDYQSEIEYMTEDIKHETKPTVLWNLDGQNKRKSPFCGYNYQDEPVYKKTLFDDEEDQIIDYEDWKKVDIENWESNHTKNWLLYASTRLRQPYHDLSLSLIMPGRELFRLTREEFLMRDRHYGADLFDLLHERKSSLPSFGTLKPIADDQTSIGSENYSDGDSTSETDMGKKKVGRPRIVDPKKKEPKVKLWEFIRNLLLNPKYCPLWICWEDYEKKRFRFVESDRVAKLWGERKNNKNMTYEKFSRAMRYYYPKNIFVAVPGRRLVYEFGSKAKGLETSCPNFNQSISPKHSIGPKFSR